MGLLVKTFYIVSEIQVVDGDSLVSRYKIIESVQHPTGWRVGRTKFAATLEAARALIPKDKIRQVPGSGQGADIIEYWS